MDVGGVGFPIVSGPLCHLHEDGVCEGDPFFVEICR